MASVFVDVMWFYWLFLLLFFSFFFFGLYTSNENAAVVHTLEKLGLC